MNLIRIILVFLMLMGIGYAQQKPYYSQYVLNNYLLNPAFAGIENYTDIKISYRNQWTELNGAPVTSYITINKPMGDDKDVKQTASSMRTLEDNPDFSQSSSYDENAKHHGLGFTFLSDKIGYINRISLGLTEAYHVPINDRKMLSAGITMGISTINLDRSKIEWGNMISSDPALGAYAMQNKKLKTEFSAGLLLYDTRFFLGASVLNILPGKVNYSNMEYNAGEQYKPHYFLQTGYRFYLNENYYLTPSLLVQYVNGFPLFVHVNTKLNYGDLVWIGAGYRYKDELSGVAAMLGLSLSKSIAISYMYNASANSRLRTFVGNTHELMIGLPLKKEN